MEAQAPPRTCKEIPKSSKEVQSEPKASQGEAKVSPRRPKGSPKGTQKIRRPLVGVFRTPWEVYLPPTPLRWTPSPTLPPKTSGGNPQTAKPNHLSGRAVPKPRTPSQVPLGVTLGPIWGIRVWASGFCDWASGFGDWASQF